MSSFGMARRLCCAAWKLRSSLIASCKDHNVSLPSTTSELKTFSPLTQLSQTREHSNSTVPDNTVTAKGKRSGERHTTQKLHNRVLTEEEKAAEENLRANSKMQYLQPDSFGTFRRSKTKSKEADDYPEGKETVAAASTTAAQREQTDTSDSMGSTYIMSGENHLSSTPWKSERVHSSKSSRKSYKQTDLFADTFGTLQEDDFEERIQESLTSTVGSHEER